MSEAIPQPLACPQNVRREFVTGVLSEEELGNKIFVHQLRNGYAARVSNLRAYDAVRRTPPVQQCRSQACNAARACAHELLPQRWRRSHACVHPALHACSPRPVRSAGQPRCAAEVDVPLHAGHERTAVAAGR